MRNGYTFSPPSRDPDHIAYESIEAADSVAELLERRFNTLQPQATGLCAWAPNGQGYTVVFRYRDGGDEVGRAVTMSAYFDNLRMEHMDFLLRTVVQAGRGCTTLPSRA